MTRLAIKLGDQCVEVTYPEALDGVVRQIVPDIGAATGKPSWTFSIHPEPGGENYAIVSPGDKRGPYLDRWSCARTLADEIVHYLLLDLSNSIALHAGAVGCDDGLVIIPGASGAGKTSLCAWYHGKGFDYYTDELVVSPATLASNSDPLSFSALARPLFFKNRPPGVLELDGPEIDLSAPTTSMPNIVAPKRPDRRPEAHKRHLLVFPRFEKDGPLGIAPLTPAQAGLQLMACNVNGRNLPVDGFDSITHIARNVPAVALNYGDTNQIDDVLENLTRCILKSELKPQALTKTLYALGAPRVEMHSTGDVKSQPVKHPVPETSARRFNRKLTIGMATYDDYDGAYFSIQTLRMFHPEILDDVEFLVIDNNPTGICAASLKKLEDWIDNYRYVPCEELVGTAVRHKIFELAGCEAVLCIDSHVLVVPGAIEKLIAWFDAHPQSKDLLQGPLLYDDLQKYSSHFEPRWRQGMYGAWAIADEASDPGAPAFEIPMQGLGLFACRTEVWPGFNPRFSGFGGEEGYIHEVFRRAGGQTLCLRFLRWLHRFERPGGAPYPNVWEHRIRNYFIAFTELGWDTGEMEAQFSEIIGREKVAKLWGELRAEELEEVAE